MQKDERISFPCKIMLDLVSCKLARLFMRTNLGKEKKIDLKQEGEVEEVLEGKDDVEVKTKTNSYITKL